MTDVVVLAGAVSTPIKLAWLLWLVWSVVQIGWYRKARVAAPAVARPAPWGRLEEHGVAQALAPASPVAPPAPVAIASPIPSPIPHPDAALAAPAAAGSPADAPTATPTPQAVNGGKAPSRRRRRPPRPESIPTGELESVGSV